jgi:predicted RND superfamily exporter protein
MWQAFARLIIRNRVAILIVIGVLTCLFLWSTLTKLQLDNKYGNTLPKDSPAQRTYSKLQKMFGEDGGTMVVSIQSKHLYTKRNFLKWKQLGDKIAQMPGVNRVISEATLFNLINDTAQKKFIPEAAFSDTTFEKKSIEQVRKSIRSNPLYKNILFNDSTGASLMMISVDESYISDKVKSKVVVDIEELASTYSSYFGKVHFAGLPHIRVIIGKRVMHEMYFFIGLAIVVISSILLLYFRSFKIVLVCNFIVGIAVIWSLGTIGFLGYKLSILMALIPPLIIIIGIPSCVYLLNRFHQEMHLHGNKVKAIARVISKTGNSTFMASSTTIVGFFCFAFANSQKLTEFGLAASLDILLLFCLSITLIPIISYYSKVPQEKDLKHLESKFVNKILDAVVYYTANKRKSIYIIVVLLIIISSFGMTKIVSTGNITGDLPKEDPILKDLNFVQDNFKGAIPFEVMVNYKDQSKLFSSTTLEKIEAVQHLFKQDTLFSRSLAITDFVKFVNMSFYGGNPAMYKLFSKRDLRFLKEYMENMKRDTMKIGSLNLKQLVDTSNTIIRIRMQIRDIGSYDVEEKVAQLQPQIDSILNPDKSQIERYFTHYKNGNKAYVDSIIYSYPVVYNKLTSLIAGNNEKLQYEFDLNPDKIKKYYTKNNFSTLLRMAIDHSYMGFDMSGTAVVAAEGARFLVKNLFDSLFFAVLIIVVLMISLFVSFRMVLISVIPNLIPSLATAGLMGFLGIPIKPSTVVVFSIALGISVDNTIYFLTRYRQELKHAGWDLRPCVTIAIKEMGISMFYASTILLFGFFVFSFSQFGGTKVLGILVGFTLLVDVLMNLFLVPSLVQSINRRYVNQIFKEPLFDIFNEDEDIEYDELVVESDEKKQKSPEEKSDNT